MSKPREQLPLPKDLSFLDSLPPAELRVRVYTDTRRYGKKVTIIDGLDPRTVDVRGLASKFKSLVAAGGTHKDDRIELQGDHPARVRLILEKLGFHVEGSA